MAHSGAWHLVPAVCRRPQFLSTTSQRLSSSSSKRSSSGLLECLHDMASGIPPKQVTQEGESRRKRRAHS